MLAIRSRLLTGLAVALLATTAGACAEKLEGDAACPALCPDQNIPVRDTLLEGVVTYDTSLVGFPARGAEEFLLLARRGPAGDTLQTAVVVRFDLLTRTFVRSATDTATVPITAVSGAGVRLRLDRASIVGRAPVTVLAYDVDVAGIDEPTDVQILANIGVAARLLGSVTLDSAALFADSIIVPIADSALLDKIVRVSPQRLRIGFSVTSASPAQLRFTATTPSGSGPVLRYDPSPADTGVRPVTLVARSSTPASLPVIASELADYTIAIGGSPLPGADALAVGGLPGRRSYLRFEVPAALVDSTTIIRATLYLTQRPGPNATVRDTLTVYPLIGIAGREVTDVGRASLLTLPFIAAPPAASSRAFGIDSLRVAAADSGLRKVELRSLLRRWATVVQGTAPRAIVLRAALEGASATELRFFSVDAADPSLRPRLFLEYVPRSSFGVP